MGQTNSDTGSEDIEELELEQLEAAMVAPDPMPCSVDTCNFTTPPGIPSFQLVLQALQLHMQGAHPAPQPLEQIQHKGSGKIDKRPRPEAKPDMSEHDFRFFESE